MKYSAKVESVLIVALETLGAIHVVSDSLGRDIDTLDNLAHALLLPMPADFHVRQLKSALPELVAEMKKHFAEVFDENPWEGGAR